MLPLMTFEEVLKMSEYKHDFVDDNPYIVYSGDKEQSYPGELADLIGIISGIKIADAGKVLGVDESGELALITLE